MIYRINNRNCHNCNKCSNMLINECDMEQNCSNVEKNICNHEMDDCMCGFEEEYNVFPVNHMYGQSYVPIQRLDQVFKPPVGLRHGTIFPELVSAYCPNQSIEEIEYIRATNTIGEGCNNR